MQLYPIGVFGGGAMTLRRNLPTLVGLLLVLSAALVILGVSLERGSETHSGNAEVAETVERGHDEHGGDESTGHADEEAGEPAFVKSLESPAVLAGLAVVSVGLAVLVWRRPNKPVTATVAVTATAAGVADVLELTRHLSAERTGLAVLAVVIVILRVLTVTGALVLWRNASRPASASV